MSCHPSTAAAQINRFGALPFFNAITPEAKAELVSIAAREAEDAEHLSRAVAAWIDDARDENNRPPTQQELRNVLRATATSQIDPTKPISGDFCGRCTHGWVFRDLPTHTEAGRCVCVPGGWVRP